MIGPIINNEKAETFAADMPKRNRTFDDFLNAITWATVSFLLIFVAMLYMTQISGVGEIDFEKATYETAILYIINIAVNILMRSYMRRKGKLNKAWVTAFNAVEENNNKIVSSGYAARISQFCRQWEDEELKNAQTHVLADAGITLQAFMERYIKYDKKELRAAYPDLSDFEFKTIIRAKRVKRLKFDEGYLSVYNKSGRRHSPSQGMTVSTLKKLSILRVLVLTAITSALGVSIAVELVAEPTFATVVMCLVKISTIVISAIMSMIGEYNTTTVKEVEEMRVKCDWQNRFINWCEQNKALTAEKIGGTLGVQENA